MCQLREDQALGRSGRPKRDRRYMTERRSKQEVGHASKMSYAAPALEKGLDILELLAWQRDGLTKSQLARLLDRSASEIFRMLVCLEQRGYIAQGKGAGYLLTQKPIDLVRKHPPTERLIADAAPVMRRLAYKIRQSCHLGVVDADRVLILVQINPPTNLGFYVKPGATMDLMESASGNVIMAHQNEEEREGMLMQWSRRTGKRQPADLANHLKRIRRTGFEKRASNLVKGVVDISFPILDVRGTALGALEIPHIQHTLLPMAQRDVIAASRDAADDINRAIAGRHAG